MADPTTIPQGAPLAHNAQGSPLVYPALGAVFHLELLEPDDAERLEEANALAWDWLGAELKWAAGSFIEETGPAEAGLLDYVSYYPRSIADPIEGETELACQRLIAASSRHAHADFEVAMKGDDDERAASPYSYRFWAEIPERIPEVLDPVPAYSVLQLTVPIGWDPADFKSRVLAIASKLRLRWGAAGFTYAHWFRSSLKGFDASSGHARRHVGFDVAEYVRLMPDFYDRIRTVNWLTLLGPAMRAKLEEHPQALVSSELVEVIEDGDLTVLVAGAQPEPGDANRLQYPRAYVEADAMVRPIRASTEDGMMFLGNWKVGDVRSWLRRFERRVS